jgi:hypothetical protein
MPYRIRTLRDRLEIEIDAPRGQREAFRELLEACTQGERACPALRCGAIDTSVPAGAEETPIRITLTPRPGVTVDPALIERCLGFTLGCGRRGCPRAGAGGAAATASPQ